MYGSAGSVPPNRQIETAIIVALGEISTAQFRASECGKVMPGTRAGKYKEKENVLYEPIRLHQQGSFDPLN